MAGNYWNRDQKFLAPHYQSWIWACYLWGYNQTGFEPFLQRAKAGIKNIMDAYPENWRWTNGFQQERARMILPLAWLVRIEDTKENRDQLYCVASEMIKAQDSCGGIREELFNSKGSYPPPTSNEKFGTSEAPLIQSNDDSIADLLYTSNFAFF